MTEKYSTPKRRTKLAAGAAFAVLVILSILIGAGEFSLASLFHDPGTRQLFAVSRLPRTIAAVLTGAALAIAGLIMQALVRNRFVEPSTAGTAQSAALGILIMTLIFPGAALSVKMLAASVLAFGGTSIFMLTAHRLPPSQPYLVPLFALVYGGVIGAVVTFIGWQTDMLQFVDIWTNGEFSGVVRGRYELLWGIAIMAAIAWWVADRLTVLSLGHDVSVGLGLSYRRTLQLGLVIVSVISALTVVIVGIIPFVGLVVPNLVSRIMGDNLRATIPWVGLSGAGLLLGCDVLARVLRYPYEIPVATVMGVVGAVLFLRLMFMRTANA